MLLYIDPWKHRDLHWGQILVKTLPTCAVKPLMRRGQNHKAKSNLPKRMMEDKCHSVQVTLIDLGLARMDARDGAGGELVLWTPLDNEIFMGEGLFIKGFAFHSVI
jgi:serine/threonine-protein kinase haspin